MYYNNHDHEMYIDEHIKTTPFESYIEDYLLLQPDRDLNGIDFMESSSGESGETSEAEAETTVEEENDDIWHLFDDIIKFRYTLIWVIDISNEILYIKEKS